MPGAITTLTAEFERKNEYAAVAKRGVAESLF